MRNREGVEKTLETQSAMVANGSPRTNAGRPDGFGVEMTPYHRWSGLKAVELQRRARWHGPGAISLYLPARHAAPKPRLRLAM